jgi:hypothetical protein
VSERRVNALAGFGFTRRQRESLVTAMVLRSGSVNEASSDYLSEVATRELSARTRLQVVVKELRSVIDERPITAAEVQEAKDRQTRTLAGRWESGGSVMGAITK